MELSLNFYKDAVQPFLRPKTLQGFKVLVFNWGEVRSPVFQGMVWSKGWNECLGDVSDSRGLYAYMTYMDALAYHRRASRRETGRPFIVQVDIAGSVAIHEFGYRCSHMRVNAVMGVNSIARRMGNYFDVPVLEA